MQKKLTVYLFTAASILIFAFVAAKLLAKTFGIPPEYFGYFFGVGLVVCIVVVLFVTKSRK